MSSPVQAPRGGLGPVERVVRVVGGGLLAALAAVSALTSEGVVTWVWLAAALVGLDFVVTGIRGYCPLYARLGLGRSRARADR